MFVSGVGLSELYGGGKIPCKEVYHPVCVGAGPDGKGGTTYGNECKAFNATGRHGAKGECVKKLLKHGAAAGGHAGGSLVIGAVAPPSVELANAVYSCLGQIRGTGQPRCPDRDKVVALSEASGLTEKVRAWQKAAAPFIARCAARPVTPPHFVSAQGQGADCERARDLYDQIVRGFDAPKGKAPLKTRGVEWLFPIIMGGIILGTFMWIRTDDQRRGK